MSKIKQHRLSRGAKNLCLTFSVAEDAKFFSCFLKTAFRITGYTLGQSKAVFTLWWLEVYYLGALR